MIAAVGTDGRRPVVWGIGTTEAKAHADAMHWLSQVGLDPRHEPLTYHYITKAQAQVILDGDCRWPPPSEKSTSRRKNSRYGHGKFDTYLDAALYSVSLDGGPDEECGDVNEVGLWAGFMRIDSGTREAVLAEGEGIDGEDRDLLADSKAAIITENTQGFVNVEWYDNVAKAEDDWKDLCDELSLEEEDD